MAAPVKNTCPDIDKCIKWLNGAIKDAESGMKITDRNSDEHDYFRYIINQIEDIEGILEDLRSANDALRTWLIELVEFMENTKNIHIVEPNKIRL